MPAAPRKPVRRAKSPAPRKPATKPGLTKRHPGWKTFIALLGPGRPGSSLPRRRWVSVVRIRPGRGRSNHKLLASMAKAKARSKTGRKPRGRVLKATTRQTGRSDLARDRQRKAMQPGKRRSASGRIYYETRKNRSDLRGSRV